MTIFQALLLGIIEGLTEFLPISSTAHLLVANNLLNIKLTSFVISFDIYIQLGAILAVAVLYLKTLLRSPQKILLVTAAFIPTALIGLFFYPVIKNIFLTNLLIVGLALLFGGLGIIIFEYWHKKRQNKEENLSVQKSVLVGVCQALAMIPGVSRSAATILGGLALKVKRQEIVEFSFLLALPTMAAATILDLYKSDFSFTTNEWLLLAVGFGAAFITALLAIKWFLNYIQKNNFTFFGIYRIIIGLLILLFLL